MNFNLFEVIILKTLVLVDLRTPVVAVVTVNAV